MGVKETIKQKLDSIIGNDASLSKTIENLEASKPKGIKEFFNHERWQTLIQKFALVFIALRDKYCASQGITEDELIGIIAKWLDDKFSFPIYIEPFDEMIFKWVLKAVVNAIEKASEMPEKVAFYKNLISNESTATV